MGKPYADEMASLGHTLSWAETTPVNPLVEALCAAYGGPLVVIGSGGSLTTCRYMAMLHQRMALQPARVSTPLEMLQEPLGEGECPWFVSAGGANTDILKAFHAAVRAEPRALGVLCADASSRLASAARQCAYSEVALFEVPTGKDGFLATNSLVAFCVLLLRAYTALSRGTAEPFQASARLRALSEAGPLAVGIDAAKIERVLERDTLIVLHGAATKPAAWDVESRFTEAALGWVQVADYRNFAHGRHHWLAKRAAESAVMALVSSEEIDLASRTLATLPDIIPALRVDLSPDWRQAGLEALVLSERLAQWKGNLRAIDPGRPGVPPFGHHIYDLNYKVIAKRAVSVDDSTRAVVERKAKQPLERLADLGVLEAWLEDLREYRRKLRRAKFAALVLDYDGTLVGPKKRTEPPPHEIVTELARLLEAGVAIGIATGRGVSVREALRKVFQPVHWPNVHIGYYNGAEVAALTDDDAPNRDAKQAEALVEVASALDAHRELAALAKQTVRPWQITLEPSRPIGDAVLWTLANDVVRTLGIAGVRVVRSSHSADILAPGVSKRNVIDQTWKLAGPSLAEPLCIGDRGCWPGNDFELLAGPHSLSVDEVSGATDRCWNLAAPTVRGVAATKAYLARLTAHPTGRGLAFDAG